MRGRWLGAGVPAGDCSLARSIPKAILWILGGLFCPREAEASESLISLQSVSVGQRASEAHVTL